MAGAVLVFGCFSRDYFDPALATEDVVNAGRHLIPLKVVPKLEKKI